MSSDASRAVDHQYRIDAAPERVFEAISDPTWIVRWLCDRAVLPLRAGAAYELGWSGGPTHVGKVLEYRAGERISLAWSWPGVELSGTVLTLVVEKAGDGSLFRIQHTGFPRAEAWTDLYGGAEWGWTYFAMNLKSVLEGGRDLRAKEDG